MPDTQKQVKWAYAVLSGKIKGATSGERDFAQEVVSGMHGRKMNELPEAAKPKAPRYSGLTRKSARKGFRNYGK